jgi:spermidine synthase
MIRISTIWKANGIAFISSFCVMVIELIASRILAPYIGVSLYTWTSIIGVIMMGIALGNFIGGKIADRYPHPSLLVGIFFAGSLSIIGILPFLKWAAYADWFTGLPLMLNFILRTACVFFLPAIILSMVSPVVIKLTLADTGKTGGVVGTIYACSTAGSIVGTFMTGFFFILWFGTRTTIWLVAAILILTGILSWLVWKVPSKWKLSTANLSVWIAALVVISSSISLFQFRDNWGENWTKESNYYTIRVFDEGTDIKVLALDRLIHSYVIPDNPSYLKYDYLRVFSEIVGYFSKDNPAPNLLHLGGGGYSFPRYMETTYPGSTNEVIEIDPAVTQVAFDKLGLSPNTKVVSRNQDARLFLKQRTSAQKYDVVIGDVFNDFSTPYHLTTLEFDRLVKSNMKIDGVYLINIIDDFQNGKYMPAFVYTLKREFKYVHLFGPIENWDNVGQCTLVIAATDRNVDFADYNSFITINGLKKPWGFLYGQTELDKYLAERNPILLTDEYAPTDILVAPLIRQR